MRKKLNTLSSGTFRVYPLSKGHNILPQTNEERLKYNNNNKNTTYVSIICNYIGIIFSILLIGSISLAALYRQTYIYQSTTLLNILTPVHRTSCYTPKSISPTDNLPIEFPSTTTTTKLKIGIVMLYSDNTKGNWPTDLTTEILHNRQVYCNKHGYTLLIGNHLIDKSRPAAWSKLLAISYYLPLYDYIFYLDTDIVIMNMNIKLEYIINTFSGFGTSNSAADIFMTEDWSGPNTGAWLIKNTNFSTWFLNTAWNEGSQFINKYTSNGLKLPFEYEQRVFHYLLQTHVWVTRGLPVYTPVDSATYGTTDTVPSSSSGGVTYTSNNIIQHIRFIPQCTMNSYSIHPFYMRGDREVSQYIPGDFLIHFAGKKGQVKIKLIRYYLQFATLSY